MNEDNTLIMQRQARSEVIIETAKMIFIERGFEDTSMDEIAVQSHLTKRTIYKYFLNKEDLFFAVVLTGIKPLFSSFSVIRLEPCTGLDKLRRIADAFRNFSQSDAELFKLFIFSQFVKPVWTSESFQGLIQQGNILFSDFELIVKEGKKDGSIRPDFQEPLGMFAVFFLLTGFYSRLIESGKNYASIYGLDLNELSNYANMLLFRSISQEII